MPKAIRQIRIEGNVAYVPLTRGYEAIIDAADVPIVAGFNWVASVKSHTTYAIRTDRLDGKRCSVLLHRFILGIMDRRDLEVDHKNCNGMDNRRDNLRLATRSQNNQNRRIGIRNTSGFKGVSWDNGRRKWIATIKIHGRSKRIGQFSTPETAATAYAIASARIHGEFGRLH